MASISLTQTRAPMWEMIELTRAAEGLGFDAAWFGDHVVNPVSKHSRYPFSPSGDPNDALPTKTPLVDPLVLIGHLTAATDTIRLGTGIYVAALRHPLLIARAVATAQDLSRGRVVFGIGAGWLREEFDALGVSYDERGRRTDETLAILALLWSGRPQAYAGNMFHFDELEFEPIPSTPVPLVLGGSADRMLQRAATWADGWYAPSTFDLHTIMHYRDRLEALRGDAGTASRPFSYYVRLRGGLDAENVRRYADAGFEDIVLPTAELWDGAIGLDAKMKRLEVVASDLEMKPR